MKTYFGCFKYFYYSRGDLWTNSISWNYCYCLHLESKNKNVLFSVLKAYSMIITAYCISKTRTAPVLVNDFLKISRACRSPEMCSDI